MAAGSRSLLAPWIGGAASAPAGSAGVRGLFAFWAGGASSLAPANNAGQRSLLAFWMGGASMARVPTPPAVVITVAYWDVQLGHSSAKKRKKPVDLLLLLST